MYDINHYAIRSSGRIWTCRTVWSCWYSRCSCESPTNYISVQNSAIYLLSILSILFLQLAYETQCMQCCSNVIQTSEFTYGEVLSVIQICHSVSHLRLYTRHDMTRTRSLDHLDLICFYMLYTYALLEK